MSRVSVILLLSLAVVVGCTLSDPKARPKVSPSKVPTSGEKTFTNQGDRSNSPLRPTTPSEPDGLPSASAEPAAASPTIRPGAPTIKNPEPAPSETSATQTQEPKIAMDLDYSDLRTEFFNVVARPFRYSSAHPAVQTSTGECRIEFEYNLDPKTMNKYLGVVSVKVEDKSWDEFSVKLMVHSPVKTAVTETSDATHTYHNLTISEIKDSGEKQRMTIQYLFANNNREVRAITFNRGLITNEHRDLVCVLPAPKN